MQRFTPETAREFDSYSAQNAAAIRAALTCKCEPYADVFTFARWIAQGRAVQKGQHGVKIATFAPVTKRDEATGETVTIGRRPWRSTVFCRCQTAPTVERTAR